MIQLSLRICFKVNAKFLIFNLAENFHQLNHGNSLFELSSKRKLARMRANNPILNMEDKQEELYSIQQAVTQLGGISDTLASIQESLVNNEIANIKNKVK